MLSHRQALAIFAVLAVAGVVSAAVDDSVGLPRLKAAGRWFVDPAGRTVTLHGVNQVNKRPPYTAEAIGFDERHGDYLKHHGFSAVRLGVMWDGLEPTRGSYEPDYLPSIMRTVNMLCRRGIYTLLDVHQDAFSLKSGGAGFPDWAARSTTPASDAGFPAIDFGGGPNKNISAAVPEDYGHFFNNTDGVRDSFMRMISHVAEAAGDSPCVLGLEFMNEPMPEKWYECGHVNPKSPLGFNFSQGCEQWEPTVFTTWIQESVDAIRAVNPHLTIFYPQLGVGGVGAKIRSGKIHDPSDNLAFSWHNYAVGHYKLIYDHTFDHQPVSNAALMMTEFGANPDPSGWIACIELADTTMMPWMYWAYSNNPPFKFSPTGGHLPPNPRSQGMVFNPNLSPHYPNNTNHDVLRTLVRPHARATAGTPLELRYDAPTKQLLYRWRPATEGAPQLRSRGDSREIAGNISEMYLPRLVYSRRPRVEVTGAVEVPCKGTPVEGVYCLKNLPGAKVAELRVSA